MIQQLITRLVGPCMLCALGVIGGCAKPVDLVATGAVQVQPLSSPSGQPCQTSVILDDHVLRVTGTIRPTAPTATRPASHLHVDIEFVSKEGNPIQRLRLQPKPASGEDANLLTYSIAYVWTPPPGTVLRIAYSHDVHYSSGGGFAGGGSGGSAPGLVGSGAPGGLVRSQASYPSSAVRTQTAFPAQPMGAYSPSYGGRGR